MTKRKAVKSYSRGADRWNWKGGRSTHPLGYITIPVIDGGRSRHQFEHIVIAERALGHSLPKRAQVHHVNGRPGDNSRGNLVVCQDHAYHQLLHRRQRALEACGNANAHRCRICGRYDRQDDIRAYERKGLNSIRYTHRSCNNALAAEYRRRHR